jgi:hypothetical protein
MTTRTGGKVKLKVIKLTFAKVNAKRRRGKKLKPVWWIEGLPFEECQRVRCGPYEEYEHAQSDRRGMQEVFDNEDYK